MVWMLTSKRIGWKDRTKLGERLAAKPERAKFISVILMLFAFILAILHLGVGSGLFAAIVILMAMGSVIVLFFPFRYVSMSWIFGLYVVSLFIELFIR
ncbi:hypothetical protein SAMN05660206_10197 [Sphingobacterium wenxiniae]|uniref:Uncharacterized protein n=2 Tax=Sphingobacterium wenxiniae TaxID=683125 RepID=A0A1I6NTU5_9SPHI|nr:hypothetical protein SAMN05660206_10197 [Sphingobacterium wenxiniae]